MRGARGLWLVVWCACRPGVVSPVGADVRVDPIELDFGTRWTQTSSTRELTIFNESRRTLEVSWSLQGRAFTMEPPPGSLAPGERQLAIAASSFEAGTELGTLTLTVEGVVRATVPLKAVFRDPPDCGQANECATLRFDRATDRCVVEPRADGVACGRADRCLADGRCRDGECEGEVVRCDDGDPCTTDGCETVRGCVAVPRECPNPSPCLAGVCVPGVGCQSVPVTDGVRCGDVENSSCTQVEVCVAGACVRRDPPDGFLCAPATPCQGEGRCANDVCVRPAATPLAVRWRLGDRRPDGGVGDAWSDPFYDLDGGAVLSSYFATPPMLRAGPAGLRLPVSARRCIAWNALLVCADNPPQGVTAVSAFTGQPAWVYTQVLADLPALALPDWQTFLARLVSLGPTRVGALYESRPLGPNGEETNCRRFSLVVLDEAGRRTLARTIEDPIFETCNHPHSYGVAADPRGNVYFAFTPSARTTPALPDPAARGTQILSYSPAGVLRWSRFVAGMPGGEISVGRGLLTVESGPIVYDAVRGVPVDGFSVDFGEGLIARDWVVAGPKRSLDLELRQVGRDAGVVRVLNGSGVTTQSGLRGASFGGQPIALRVSSDATGAVVEAFPLGPFLNSPLAPLFRCAAPGVGPTSSFEVKPGALLLMTGTEPLGGGLCESCDPPFAGTRSVFIELEVPGLLAPSMPWPGPWGGNGHDHQEDP